MHSIPKTITPLPPIRPGAPPRNRFCPHCGAQYDTAPSGHWSPDVLICHSCKQQFHDEYAHDHLEAEAEQLRVESTRVKAEEEKILRTKTDVEDKLALVTREKVVLHQQVAGLNRLLSTYRQLVDILEGLRNAKE